MYYEYWHLQKPPFDNVPDPGMYVDCHESLENAIADTLFAIEEGNECLSVIVGDVGLGKTLSIRLIIDSLESEKYKIALVTNPGISFIQLLREIIGQLTGKECEQKKKSDLFETFNKILFETADEGRKVLIFIDEANAISPANLESLRLLTNMQDDQKNLFTIILAGQMELAVRLEHPKRANLFQRIGTFSRINRIPSADMVKTYIETRLSRAGATTNIFSDDAIALLWEYSENGVPRLINKIAKLCLKAGETNGFRQIEAEVVRQIGERFQNLTGKAIQKRKPRKRLDESLYAEKELTGILQTEKPDREEIDFPRFCAEQEFSCSSPISLPEEQVDVEPCIPLESETQKMMECEDVRAEEEAPRVEDSTVVEMEKRENATAESLEIAGIHVVVDIPSEIRQKALYSNKEQCMKSAGFIAAQVLRKYPELTADPSADPIVLWSDIRNILLERLVQQGEMNRGTALVAVV